MIRAGQAGGHGIGALEDRLRVAGDRTAHKWMVAESAKAVPLASALGQAAPDLDPLADPNVRVVLEAAQAAAEAAGYHQGKERADKEREELRATVEGIGDALAAATQRDAEAIVALALAVAEGMLGRELAGDSDALVEGVKVALGGVEATKAATVRANPDDLEALESASVVAEGTALESDSTLARGEFQIDSPTNLIDARLGARLEPLRSQLIELVRAGES